MPWWDDYFENSNKEIKKDLSSAKKSQNNNKDKDESINKKEEKQDYNYSKENGFEPPEPELDIISKDFNSINFKLNVINPMTQSKFPMNVCVIN